MFHLLVASLLLASTGTGKTLVRSQPGTMIPAVSCPAATNFAANPEVLNVNANWTANAALAPDGTATADRLDTVTAAERYVVNATPGGAILNRTFTLSAYCRAVSGTPTMYMGVTDGAAWTAGHACQSACVLNATDYTRCAVTCTYTASGASTTVGMVPFSPVGKLGNLDVAPLVVDCWGLQLVEGFRARRYDAVSGWRSRCP